MRNTYWMIRDCHRMMRVMWKDNKTAYIWLEVNLGRPVHFSRIDDLTLREAHELLFKRMIRKKFIK